MYSVIDNQTIFGANAVDHSSDISPYWPIYSVVSLLSVSGLIVNLLVMWITIVADGIVGDYRYFIFNLAFIDCVFACSGFLGGVVQPLVNYDGVFCSLFIWTFGWGRQAVEWAKVPIVLNRYILLRYANLYGSIFKRWVILLLVSVCYIIPLCFVTPCGIYFGHFGRVLVADGTSICFVHFNKDTHYFPLLAAVFATSLVIDLILLYCNCNILALMRKRKRHQRELFVGEEQRQQLRRSNELIKVNIVQTLGPLLCHIPSFIIIFLVHFTGASRPALFSLLKYAFVTLSANPLVDGLVTFLLLQPYNKALRRIFGADGNRDSVSRSAETLRNNLRQNSEQLPCQMDFVEEKRRATVVTVHPNNELRLKLDETNATCRYFQPTKHDF